MIRHFSTTLAALVAAGLAGCATAPHAVRSRDSASLLQPQVSSRTGTLVVRVQGMPRDLEYYVNGVRIVPDPEWSWWKDAKLQLELRPGRYAVEARYGVRRFSGEEGVGRIVTRGGVEVLPGRTTELRAEVRKDWRGVPASSLAHFKVIDTNDSRAAAREPAVAGAPSAAVAASRFSSARVPVEVGPGRPEDVEDAAPAVERIVIRGAEPTATPEPPHAPAGETVVSAAPPRIVIRGDQVLAEGWKREDSPSAPLASSEPIADRTAGAHAGVELPPQVEPANEDLPAANATKTVGRVIVEDATPSLLREGGTQVVLFVHSDPPGARASMDDRELGRTPLRLRIDPRSDHVFRFERQGCQEIVQLLSAASWERGRSPVLEVKLDCSD